MIEFRMKPLWLAIMFLLTLAFTVPAYLAARYELMPASDRLIMTICAIPFALASVVLLLEPFLGRVRLIVDEQGVTHRGYGPTRFIPWSDIGGVEVIQLSPINSSVAIARRSNERPWFRLVPVPIEMAARGMGNAHFVDPRLFGITAAELAEVIERHPNYAPGE